MDPERVKRKLLNKEMFSSNLLKNILTVSYNSLMIALVNLVFHLIMIRKLGPEDYGILETLLTINSIVLISVSAVGFVITRFVSYYRTRQQYDNMKFLANWAFIFFFLIGCAALFINMVLSRMLADYLHITDYSIIMIFGIIVWISFLMPIIDGILRGLQEFKYFGRYKITESVLRAVFASVLVLVGFKVRSILGAIIAASIITLISAAYILRKIYISRPHKIKLSEIYKFTIPVFITMICLAIISNIDLVLVKHFFNDTTTGYYAAAGMLAKIVFSLALGSSGVLFPKIVEYYSNGEEEKILESLHNTINIVLIPGFIITAIIALFPRAITRLFFGTQYDIGWMLSIFAVAMFFLSVAVIFTIYNLAMKKYTYIPILIIASIIIVYRISQVHATLYDVLWTLFLVDGALMIMFIFYNWKEIYLYFHRH